MAEIYFPDRNAALPEPHVQPPPQDSSLAAAFQGILGGAKELAESYEGLQKTRDLAEQAGANLRSLGREEEAKFVENMGRSARLNPFDPQLNATLRDEVYSIFRETSQSLRSEKAAIELQNIRDKAAKERLDSSILSSEKIAGNRIAAAATARREGYDHAYGFLEAQGEQAAELALPQLESREKIARIRAGASGGSSGRTSAAQQKINDTLKELDSINANDAATIDINKIHDEYGDSLLSTVDSDLANKVADAQADLREINKKFSDTDAALTPEDEREIIDTKVKVFNDLQSVLEEHKKRRGGTIGAAENPNAGELPLSAPTSGYQGTSILHESGVFDLLPNTEL